MPYDYWQMLVMSMKKRFKLLSETIKIPLIQPSWPGSILSNIWWNNSGNTPVSLNNPHRTKYCFVNNNKLLFHKLVLSKRSTGDASSFGNFPLTQFPRWGRSGAKSFIFPSRVSIGFWSVASCTWHTTAKLSYFCNIVPERLLPLSRFRFGISTGLR